MMKTFRYIVFSLLGLIVLLLLIGLMLPNRYEIQASADLERSPEVVYFHALDYSNRAQWDPWLEMDPGATTHSVITEEGVGSSWQWEGEEVGAGKLTVRSVTVHEQIRSTLVFSSNENDSSTMVWDFLPIDPGTRLRWTMKGEWGNPIARWVGIFITSSIKKSFKKGLDNFKNYVEQMPQLAGSTSMIRIEDTPPMQALIVETQAEMDNIPQAMGAAYEKLMGYFGAHGITPAGPPFSRYDGHYETGQPIRFEAGFPVQKKHTAQEDVIYRRYPASRVVAAMHRGPYSSLFITYNNVLKYINERNLIKNGPMWESYLTDPQAEPDSSQWETMVYYPVKNPAE